MWKYITDPGYAYDTVYRTYGWFGVLFLVMGLIFVGLGVWLWLDRRR